jgi:hypothetical protein
MEKPEKDARLDRVYDESIGFHYDLTREMASGLREAVLAANDIPGNVTRSEPLVILVDRRARRSVSNMADVYAHVERTCDFCEVQLVDFEREGVDGQLRMCSQASVLMGLHGSGLAHAIWLPESGARSTHLIEILPYNYTCRDWYHVAANCAGAQYHSVMNHRAPANGPEGIHECWAKNEICGTLGCHDLLRDQNVEMEIDTFAEVWTPVRDQLAKEWLGEGAASRERRTRRPTQEPDDPWRRFLKRRRARDDAERGDLREGNAEAPHVGEVREPDLGGEAADDPNRGEAERVEADSWEAYAAGIRGRVESRERELDDGQPELRESGNGEFGADERWLRAGGVNGVRE